MVQPVDDTSSKYRNLPPTTGELAKLARRAQSIVREAAKTVVRRAPVRSIERKLTPEQRAKLVARYKEGEATPALSKEYGISKCALLGLLRKEGVQMRKQSISREDASRAARLYESGLSITEVVEQIGYSYGTVRKSLHESGVAMRPKGIKRRPK